MFNSYIQTFGEPQGESSEEVDELGCELMSDLPLRNTFPKKVRSDTIKAFSKSIKESGLNLTTNDCAHLLDAAFNFANENFYELEDDGTIRDRFDLQDKFLEMLTEALQLELKKNWN